MQFFIKYIYKPTEHGGATSIGPSIHFPKIQMMDNRLADFYNQHYQQDRISKLVVISWLCQGEELLKAPHARYRQAKQRLVSLSAPPTISWNHFSLVSLRDTELWESRSQKNHTTNLTSRWKLQN